MNKSFEGYTLLELLTTLMVIVILSSMCIPYYHRIIAKNHADIAVIILFRAIQFAKTEAIKRNVIVTLCPSSNGCSCGDSWGDGCLIFVDYNSDGRIDKGDIIIKNFSKIASQGKISWKSFPNYPFLQMRAQGFTNNQNGTFTYCPLDKDNHYARALFVNKTGRVRLSQDVNGDGFDENSSGKAIFCK